MVSETALNMLKAGVRDAALQARAYMEKVRKTPHSGLNEKQEKILGLMDAHGEGMGCREIAVRELLEVLTDAPVGAFKKTRKTYSDRFCMGLIVVPLGNPNSHNYTVGQPCMYYESGRALKPNGDLGNLLPVEFRPSGDYIRNATDEEINAFAEKVSIGSMESFINIFTRVPDPATMDEKDAE